MPLALSRKAVYDEVNARDHAMKHFDPMLVTVAVATVVFTSVGGFVEYRRSLQDSPEQLTFWERFDYFALEPALSAMPLVIIFNIGVTVSTLPVVLLVGRRRSGFAYGCAGLLGAAWGVPFMVVRYLVSGDWTMPNPQYWALPLVGGAICAIVLTASMRRMKAAKLKMRAA